MDVRYLLLIFVYSIQLNHSVYNREPCAQSCLTFSVPVLTLLRLCSPIVVYSPKAYSDTNQACPQRDKISITITIQAFVANSLPIGQDDRMPIVDMAIGQIEYVTEKDRRKSHGAPILTQAIHTEGLSNERWVDAKEEAVG